jgi:uncharacterized membrane protein SpoIIM required for sporulation
MSRIMLAFMLFAIAVMFGIWVVWSLFWYLFIIPSAKLKRYQYDNIKRAIQEANQILKGAKRKWNKKG